MITERQEQLLGFLIKEYLLSAEPVSSLALKKVIDLDVCGATIRNDLQELTKQGFIKQPHTSAGRTPTEKAYKYFAEKLDNQKQKEFDDFIVRQVKFAHQEMEQEMKFMGELMQTLENDNLFEILNILDTWHKTRGPES
jgi:heat-inducible transcriptional repressor